MSTFGKSDGWVFLISTLVMIAVCVIAASIPGLVACYKSVLTCLDLEGMTKLAKVYDDKLRSDFFAGFLAVGAFLLSLKTFIVMTMKINVYDTSNYEDTWKKQFALDPRVGPRYKGLKRLNDCLFNSILASLVAAVAQVSIGLVGGVVITILCVWLCAISVIYLTFCLYLVKRNLDSIIPTS
ncbi:hypothetical protein AWU82_03580 [Pseudomonas glycinae]|jgi:hypothetical protein|uniref:Transmembrane protein n=1 Tax=Pseudomonas glycinae TaxID=1785145 RepID=A0ABN4MKN8_9PSED|nr:hypothetical protein AWU82_03580 [Pseudomonas glycinae]